MGDGQLANTYIAKIWIKKTQLHMQSFYLQAPFNPMISEPDPKIKINLIGYPIYFLDNYSYLIL